MIVAVWSPGVAELIIVLAVLLLLFGAKRLPEIGRSIGRSIRELKRGTRSNAGEVERASPGEGGSD